MNVLKSNTGKIHARRFENPNCLEPLCQSKSNTPMKPTMHPYTGVDCKRCIQIELARDIRFLARFRKGRRDYDQGP